MVGFRRYIMGVFKTIAASAAFSLALGWAPLASADLLQIDLSGGSQWRSTTDGLLANQWTLGNFSASDGVAAYAPYGNSATNLNANRMMWSCGVDGSTCRDSGGNITGASGPTEVFFGYSFFVAPGQSILAAQIAIIADDFFDLVVNNQGVMAALLTDHLVGGQPEPIIIDLMPFLHVGNNVLAIRAMDGVLMGAGGCDAGFTQVTGNLGPFGNRQPIDFCKGDLLNEYMFISGSALVIPEPGVLSLILLGLAGVIGMRRRGAGDDKTLPRAA
jgi:hypothetical protein